MGIKEDYMQAQKHIKAGNLEGARNLLLVHDHPKTNALLKRIESRLQVSDNNVQPALWKRLLSAFAVLAVATGIALWAYTTMYNITTVGYQDETRFAIYAGVMWLLIVFIGFRYSHLWLGK